MEEDESRKERRWREHTCTLRELIIEFTLKLMKGSTLILIKIQRCVEQRVIIQAIVHGTVSTYDKRQLFSQPLSLLVEGRGEREGEREERKE